MQDRTNTTHKIKASSEQFKEMLDYYKGYITYNNNPYVVARIKLSKATITFYKTNVVLFQGENESVEYNIWAEKYNLEKENIIQDSTLDLSSLSTIGSDEVGTGDYFGPITVCASFVSLNMVPKLKELGVKDSKLLTDNQIIEIGLKLADLIPYSIIFLEPSKINRLKEKHANLNFIKSYLHNKAINSILKKYPNVKYDAIIIDQFTPKEKYFEYLNEQPDVIKNITMIPKAESKNLAVAASSILARVAFLKELKRLSNNYDMTLLKGAGQEVDRTAINFVKKYGYDELLKVAKIKFANTNRIKSYFETNPLPKNKQGSINK